MAQLRLSSRKAKPLIGFLVIAAAVVYLMTMGMRSSSAYYMTVGEVLDAANSTKLSGDQRIRVSGDIVGDSVRWDSGKVLLSFSVKEGGRTLAVEYNGIKPDNFADATQAIVEGYYKAGVVKADKLMLKCPSKYESEKKPGAAKK